MKKYNKFIYSRGLIILLIAALSIINLFVINFIIYSSMKNIIKDSVLKNELELSNNLIHQTINQELQPLIIISKTLSNDFFIIDYLKEETKDKEFMVGYLTSLKEINNFTTCFLVDDNDQLYYNMNGIFEISNNMEDAKWYYDFLESDDIIDININVINNNNNLVTIFINCKIYDTNDTFLGVTGVGIELNSIPYILNQYENDYNRDLYFIHYNGDIIAQSSNSNHTISNIYEFENIDKENFIPFKDESSFLEFKNEDNINFLNSNYLEDFDWWIISIQKESYALKNVEQVLIFTIIIHTVAIILTLIICALIIKILQNRMKKLATIDVLTELNNRNSFENSLNQAIYIKRKRNEDSFVLLIDIDKFKLINDMFGHLVGDEVLIRVSNLLKAVIAKTDSLFRWGGDEFVVISYNCTKYEIIELTRKIFNDLLDLGFYIADEKYNFTLSIGISEVRSNDTLDTIFKRADDALYLVKMEGGANFKFYQDPIE